MVKCKSPYAGACRQYNPKKPIRHGIKVCFCWFAFWVRWTSAHQLLTLQLYSLVCGNTTYIRRIQVFEGKERNQACQSFLISLSCAIHSKQAKIVVLIFLASGAGDGYRHDIVSRGRQSPSTVLLQLLHHNSVALYPQEAQDVLHRHDPCAKVLARHRPRKPTTPTISQPAVIWLILPRL